MSAQGHILRQAKAARSARQSLVGRGSAGRPLPAWKANAKTQTETAVASPIPRVPPPQGSRTTTVAPVSGISETGSKVFIQGLPMDVTTSDVYDLFSGQIGPLTDCYLVYNSQGHSKGAAFVHFQRAQDGVRACGAFNGKKIDNEKGIRVQLITDPQQEVSGVNTPGKRKSLKERLGDFADGSAALAPVPLPTRIAAPAAFNVPIPPKVRVKKGPRRIKTKTSAIIIPRQQPQPQKFKFRFKPKTVHQLDAEMELYRQQGQESMGLI